MIGDTARIAIGASAADRDRTRPYALLILAVAIATIGGALVSEHVFGLVPCKLCLLQRQPYYAGVPLALLVALAPERWRRAGLALLALVFLVSGGLGAYHAGVEWGFWPGPADCGGGTGNAADVNDFVRSLNRVKVVSCTDAAWRFGGLSLAGWNAVVSFALALLAVAGWRRPRTSGRT